MKKELLIPFLAKREYLNGRNLLTTLLKEYSIDEDFSFKITNVCTSPYVEILQEEQDKPAHASICFGKEQEKSLFIYPLDYKEEIPRIEYNEKVISEKAKFLEREAHFFSEKEDFIYNLVTVNKVLNTHTFAQDNSLGQWLFIRLDMKKAIPESGEYTLQLSKISSIKISSSKIVHNGEDLGTIYFSWRAND